MRCSHWSLLVMTFCDVIARCMFITRHRSTLRVVTMSYITLVLVLFSYVRVSNSDISRIQTYPPQRGKPTLGGRIPPPPPPPLPAVPLPNYVLMTASSTGEFQPDNDLEVTHEFKLHVDAGNEVCLFQKLRQNSRLYFSFKVCPHIMSLNLS